MDFSIFLFLFQDGVLTGAIYALIGVAFVLIFTVTRVIFIPQGDLVAFSALTLIALKDGHIPGSVWLLLASGLGAGLVELIAARARLSRRKLMNISLWNVVLPAGLALVAVFAARHDIGDVGRALLSIALVAPLGPYVYQIAFRPLGDASVLVLLIAAVGVHWLMIGLGLAFFGAEGFRAEPFIDANFDLGPLLVSGQSILILLAVAVVMIGLYMIAERTLLGKALQASAIDERGARLVGISPQGSGSLAFLLASFIGAVSGVLVASTTTIYFDSGFLIALKGFVAAIVGGFASYPLAVASAFFVGLSESFASFWASALKEVIVFSLILPVLFFRSFSTSHAERD